MRKEKANTSRISIDAYRSRSTIDDTGCDREMVRSRHPCPRDYMGGRGTKGSRSQRWKAATLLGHLWWIDAFNALKTEQKKNLSLAQVLQEMYDVHRRLIVYVESVPLVQFQGRPVSGVACGSIHTATIRFTQRQFGNGEKSRDSNHETLTPAIEGEVAHPQQA